MYIVGPHLHVHLYRCIHACIKQCTCTDVYDNWLVDLFNTV